MTSLLAKIRGRWRNSVRIATIDSAQAAPPPSPLAPIDLTDSSQVTGVMDIAARIGDILLSSGNANRDAKAQLHAVMNAWGLHYVHVDVTKTTITMHASIGAPRRQPLVIFRVIRGLDTDFSKLSEVDRLIRSIQAGATTPEVAAKILTELEAKPANYGAKMAVLGWGLFGGAVTLTLGGGALAVVIAAIMGTVITAVNTYLGRNGLPAFFQQIIGGVIATVPAALLYNFAGYLGVQVSPSQIIASGIVVLVAGLSLTQSLQDGIMGASATGAARFFETILMTAGIVAGVAMGIQVAETLGFALPPLETQAPPNFSSLLVRLLGAGLICTGFAIAMFAERSAVVVAFFAALFGMSFYYLVFLPLGVGGVAAAAFTATIIGLSGGLLSRRFLIPPVITTIAGITPMLPGLTLYRSMYALVQDQMLVGFTNLFVALATAGALAAGVVLGEWIARRIRRPRVFRPYAAIKAARRHTFQQFPRAGRAPRRVRRKPGA